ncbi:MAG: aminoacyl-tRNA hydrolase [Candidatus Coatesbacteria bacterium RBG_13_66_14]|uniref:Peptidyl-tRNA hydrolase n=1 Tax=Candidatus Coatesbacteria bacterium RBG_13_66_14 TaxID=1817816 RepID=A0A1F5FHD7_9BACT|nr:MAG: aminoacyl-tRNA hydrolase [Candidatus Coatesbacteria bacterium RBG_13_66_14]
MLVVGLGNPGERYAETPHNLGFMAVDELARRGRLRSWRRVCESQTGKISLAGRRLLLCKPQTFMNLSGRSVACLLRETDTPPEGLLVICDDVNLTFGALRLRPSGGSGGHNGLEDIVAHVGEGFPRMRIGCGPAPQWADLAEFVLSPFPEERLREVGGVLERVVEGLILLEREGWQTAMARVNARLQDGEGASENELEK